MKKSKSRKYKLLNIYVDLVMMLNFAVLAVIIMGINSSLKLPISLESKLTNTIETIDNSQDVEELRDTAKSLFVLLHKSNEQFADLIAIPAVYFLIISQSVLAAGKIGVWIKLNQLTDKKLLEPGHGLYRENAS